MATMPLRVIDSKLYKQCPVCRFEERHMASCVVGALEAKLKAVEELRCLISHSVPNEPVYYPDLPECHPQCQRCKLDRILHPKEGD